MNEYPEIYTEETMLRHVREAYRMESRYNAKHGTKSEGPNLILILPYGNGFFFSAKTTATKSDFRQHFMVHPDATEYEVWTHEPKIQKIREKRTAGENELIYFRGSHRAIEKVICAIGKKPLWCPSITRDGLWATTTFNWERIKKIKGVRRGRFTIEHLSARTPDQP